MRKLQKVALVVALAGSTALIGAAPAMANSGGHGATKVEVKKTDITQANKCRSHDTNISVLNNIGIANGLLGNALGGEGDPGAQFYEQGSGLECGNSAR